MSPMANVVRVISSRLRIRSLTNVLQGMPLTASMAYPALEYRTLLYRNVVRSGADGTTYLSLSARSFCVRSD
jgi:hypothetical protein